MTGVKRASSPKQTARTIGRLAREAGVNVETIRFYQREGLLRVPENSGKGWRKYRDDTLWTLRYIRQGRDYGLELREIRDLLRHVHEGKRFCSRFREALLRRLDAIEHQIEDLGHTKQQLQEALAACEARAATDSCPIAERCSLPAASCERKGKHEI